MGGTWGPGGLGRDMGACSNIMHTGNRDMGACWGERGYPGTSETNPRAQARPSPRQKGFSDSVILWKPLSITILYKLADFTYPANTSSLCFLSVVSYIYIHTHNNNENNNNDNSLSNSNNCNNNNSNIYYHHTQKLYTNTEQQIGSTSILRQH